MFLHLNIKQNKIHVAENIKDENGNLILFYEQNTILRLEKDKT